MDEKIFIFAKILIKTILMNKFVKKKLKYGFSRINAAEIHH